MVHRVSSVALAALVLGAVLFCSHVVSARGDQNGNDRVLSKIKFVHYKRDHVKPPRGGGKPGDQGSYAYMVQGARWRTTVGYLLNSANGENVAAGDVVDAIEAGMGAWETASGVGFDIFGGVTPDSGVTYNDGEFRGFNTISLGSHSDPDVIGETTVWGYFSGSPKSREIVEAHILLNDAFVWGDATGDSSRMDLQNILTHELGHCAGMGDVYDSAASEETMYGYSTEGETKKRDLFTGDIRGIGGLY